MVNLKELRNTVEETFGETVTTAKQCRMLEEAIFAETNRKISSATLRRFLVYFRLLLSFRPTIQIR